MEFMTDIVERLREVFEARGNERYGTEAVSQLEHALQTALLAKESDAGEALMVAALLHDVGHIFNPNGSDGIETDASGFDDKHEYRANAWIKQYFGEVVADPIRLHVRAKRYLCTIEESYRNELSPTSYQSYLDQGGNMSDAELREFESEPFYKEALILRRLDDRAKVKGKATPDLNEFLETCRSALGQT